jgi:excinuclease UvrABC helicase subunit UvrB
MEEAAEALDFERAIVLRDRIREMERRVGKV